MTRKRYTPSQPIERNAIVAGIRRARRLRSQNLSVLLSGLVKKIVHWNQRQALRRHLNELPDYLLKDIGIERDQIGATVSGILRRDPLALSPAGGHSAPAFQGVMPGANENTASQPERPLAA